MRLNSYSPATPTVNPVVTIATSAHSILFAVAYNGRPAASAPNTHTQCMQDLRKALNGSIAISYAANQTRNIPLLDIMPMVDAAEAYASASFGASRITFLDLGTSIASGTEQWLATMEIPLSKDGTVQLDQNTKVTLTYTGFTDAAVVGVSGTNCGAVISMEAIVVPQRAKTVMRLNALPCAAGTTTTVDLQGASRLVIPADLAKISLNATTGVVLEMEAAILPAFIQNQLVPHIYVDGFADFYDKFFALPIDMYINGQINLSSSTSCYLLQNVAI